MDDKLISFRAFLRVEKIPLTDLANAMGYSRNYANMVLTGHKPFYPVFFETLRRALIDKLGIAADAVNRELDGLKGLIPQSTERML